MIFVILLWVNKRSASMEFQAVLAILKITLIVMTNLTMTIEETDLHFS
jgi:hypothetical protein